MDLAEAIKDSEFRFDANQERLPKRAAELRDSLNRLITQLDSPNDAAIERAICEYLNKESHLGIKRCCTAWLKADSELRMLKKITV